MIIVCGDLCGDLCGVPHTQGLPHRGGALHGRAADQVRSPQLKSKTAYFSFYRKDFIAAFLFFSSAAMASSPPLPGTTA